MDDWGGEEKKHPFTKIWMIDADVRKFGGSLPRKQGLEALELGLCLKSVPADQVLAVATEIARDIASNGRLAVRQTKESLDSQFREGMGRQLRREADAQAVSYVGPDFQDRLTDLIAKTTGKNRPKSKL